MKLLLVEDEVLLSSILKKGLKKKGYAIDVADDGNQAIEMYDVNEYDLIILDLNIPHVDGIEVLKYIRQGDLDTRVLILSARADIDDRVKGLDNGANDYLVKPFDFHELEARIRSLLRRTFRQENVMIECQGVRMDTIAKQVSIEGVEVSLTKKEYGILEYLLLHKNEVISTERLLEHVWDSEVDLFTNPLKFQMHCLKKKLSPMLHGKLLVKNIRGQGYMISDAVEGD